MVLVALWGAVVALTLAAAGDGVLAGDLRVTRRVQTWDDSIADAVAAYGNWIGHYWVGVVISLPLVALLARLRRRREIALLVAILVVRALSNPIKRLIDSPRPPADLVRVSEEAHGLGFPSGHVSGMTLLCGALILIGNRLRLPFSLQTALWVVGVGTVVATGFGRIQTGVHWPSDVLGGFILGLAFLLTLATLLGLDDPLGSASGLRQVPNAEPPSNRPIRTSIRR
jgi:undecaprenyl-diphosphatase